MSLVDLGSQLSISLINGPEVQHRSPTGILQTVQFDELQHKLNPSSIIDYTLDPSYLLSQYPSFQSK